jgi:DNA-binding PadR family transcriptional regulator
MRAATATVRLSQTEYAVLGLLGHAERPLSGYDLNKLAAQSVGYVWAPSKSRLYEVLARLVEGGLAGRQDVPQSDRPDKSLYRITARGRVLLREWVDREEVEADVERQPFLLKLFFGDAGDRDAVVRQLETYRDGFAARLADYEQIERRIAGCDHDRFPYLTLRFGIARARATVAWADEALAELRT